MVNSTPAASDLLSGVIRFATTLVERGRMPTSSLFVDALDAATLKWLPVDLAEVASGTILSNFAFHQSFLRLLNGLSDLTRDETYRQVAKETVQCAFRELDAGNGLLFWGGHAALDVTRERPVTAPWKGAVHELKCCYPAYEFLWRCDPLRTANFVEAFWKAHVLDWERLHFDRHGPYGSLPGATWSNEYHGGPVFYWARGSTFVNAGSDLYYAAALLAKLSDNQQPLVWAKRLAGRYIETRHPGIGISGYQFAQNPEAWCNGRAIKGDRAQYQYAPLIPPGHNVFESTMFRPVPAVQRCQLHLGESLGTAGQAFLAWAVEELTAWAKMAYSPDRNMFIPMLLDGYSLEGLVLSRDGYFGPKGKIEKARFAGLDFFWAYARGFSSSGDEFLWKITSNIAKAIGLGDIGSQPGKVQALNFETDCADPHAIWGLLAIYDATRCSSFLELAARLARNMMGKNFVILAKDDVISPANPQPLAILNVAARLLNSELPECASLN